MAERRMISRKIAEDDRFVDMHPVSKLLYFYLVLNADDDGFVGSVKMINFLTNADQSNYDELLKNNLILEPTKSGVYVITDWYAQNKIEPKIYKATDDTYLLLLISDEVVKDGTKTTGFNYSLDTIIINDDNLQLGESYTCKRSTSLY